MRGRRRDGDGGRGGGGAACSNVMRRDIKEGGVRGRETRRREGEERRRRKEKRSKVRKKSCWWRLVLNKSEEKCQRRTGERTEPRGHLADQSVTSPVSQRARQPIYTDRQRAAANPKPGGRSRSQPSQAPRPFWSELSLGISMSRVHSLNHNKQRTEAYPGALK